MKTGVKLTAAHRWKIPADKQAQALRLAYSGTSARKTYLTMWPSGKGAPVRIDVFTRALQDLVAETEDSVRKLADAEGLPLPEDEEAIAVTLAPEAEEEPLPAELGPGLSDLRATRGVLCQVLQELRDEPLSGPDEKGRDNETITGRALAVAKVADSLAANVKTEADYFRFRLDRTLKLFAARLQTTEGEGGKDGDQPTDPPRRFVLEVPGTTAPNN